MKRKGAILLFLLALAACPAIGHAADEITDLPEQVVTASPDSTIFTLFSGVMDLMNRLVLLMISLSLVGFLWGVLRFLFSSGSEKLKKEGKDFMLYGILSLFVMTSLWGLVNLFVDFVEKDNNGFGDIKSENNIIDSPDGDGGNRIDDFQDIFENNNPKANV